MQELPKNRIIENLYYIVKDKGFSKQKELSDELGISSGHISMWFKYNEYHKLQQGYGSKT